MLTMARSFPTSSHPSCAAAPAYPGALRWTCSSLAMCFSCWGGPNWTQCSTVVSLGARERKNQFPGGQGPGLAK